MEPTSTVFIYLSLPSLWVGGGGRRKCIEKNEIMAKFCNLVIIFIFFQKVKKIMNFWVIFREFF
jgi:hypothetical protein